VGFHGQNRSTLEFTNGAASVATLLQNSAELGWAWVDSVVLTRPGNRFITDGLLAKVKLPFPASLLVLFESLNAF
jgi:hypothetical protein